jgi:hypothetical protein
VVDSVRQEKRGSGGVRLTRRGRIVLIVLAVAILLAGFWLTAGRGAFAGARGGGSGVAGQGLETVTVGRHDTLWEIASRHRPDADPRLTVHRIIDLNGLPGSIVQPGQRLRLPAR